MNELYWGFPVIGYLFLAGLGAGALTVSGSVLLRGGGGLFAGEHFRIARIGALLAPLPLILGTGMIVFELGTFQVGMQNFDLDKLFKWVNLFKTINLSPMSIGSWILGLCIIISTLFALTFLSSRHHPEDGIQKLRKALAWIGIPLGVSVAIYTGVMLGAMPARPFWNSQIMGMLFLLSALSTGVAGILCIYAINRQEHQANENNEDAGYILSVSDALIIGAELIVIFLFILFAFLTVGDPAHAIAVILPGGALVTWFWIGVVLFGLVTPVLLELRHTLPKLLQHKPYVVLRSVEISISVLVLVGGFLLRYVIVAAGQITGPIGL